MSAHLYISWGNWLGAQAAALLDEAVRAAYGDKARTFFSRAIKEGANWFELNEVALDAARAAVVLLSSDGLASHWQSYELGRLRRRCEPCILLLLDLPANSLGSTAYAYLNCSTPTNDVLRRIIRAGCDSEGVGEDERGYLTEQDAMQEFGTKLGHLLDGFASLQHYKATTGQSRADRIARNAHMERVVHGFCLAGLSVQQIADKLRAEQVPAAAYYGFFETSDSNVVPRVADAGDAISGGLP